MRGFMNAVVPKPLQNKPTSEQLEEFSVKWDKLTRPEPYVRALKDSTNLSWDEKNRILARTQELEEVRVQLYSDANKYGDRRKLYTPELALRSITLIQEMESLVPDSTGGLRNKWTQAHKMRMEGRAWEHWFRDFLFSVKKSADIMIVDKYDWVAAGDDKPLQYEDIVEYVLTRLSNFLDICGAQVAEDKEEAEGIINDFRQYCAMDDEEFNEYLQQCFGLGQLVKPYLRAINYKKTVTNYGTMPKDIESMDDRECVRYFLDLSMTHQSAALGLAVYYEYMKVVHPDAIARINFFRYATRENGRGANTSSYVRPQANIVKKALRDKGFGKKELKALKKMGVKFFKNVLQYGSDMTVKLSLA